MEDDPDVEGTRGQPPPAPRRQAPPAGDPGTSGTLDAHGEPLTDPGAESDVALPGDAASTADPEIRSDAAGGGQGPPPGTEATAAHPTGGLPPDSRRAKVIAKWGSAGRRPLLLLAGVGLIDALDRGVLAGVLTAIQEDLGVNDFQMGLLDSAYIITGLLFALPAGYLSDRARRTRVIAIVMALWTVFIAGTAAVRTYWQAFVVRTAVGIGDTIDDPASQSLMADYYPARVRGRAYAYFRATPTVGRALGIAVGGAVGAMLGWRAAFLVAALPGILLAIGVWRLREPARGESDLATPAVGSADEASTRAKTTVWSDVRTLLRIRSLRALVLGTAVGSGTLSGLAFWAVAYHERHSDMPAATAAGIVGALILLASLGGTLAGGSIADRVRGKVAGAPMLGAGLSMGTGIVLLFCSFIEGIPVWGMRIPLQAAAVALIVGALPATFAMTSEVVPASLRGTGFSLVKVSSTIIGTIAPPLVGWISDQRTYITASGRETGDLGFAFSMTVPLVLIGAFLLIRGRHTVEDDKVAAEAATLAQHEGEEPTA